jgi:hypothetical protein
MLGRPPCPQIRVVRLVAFLLSTLFIFATCNVCKINVYIYVGIFAHRIQKSEVKDALKRMKGGKAMGPDGIPIEVWRSIGDEMIVWLTKLFNLIF